MKSSLRYNAEYAGAFSSYWGSYGITGGFLSVFLLGNGYTNTEIGILIAVANVFSIFIQPVTASIADRSKRVTALELLEIVNFLMILSCGVLVFLKGRSWAMFLAYAVMLGLFTSMQPLLNSLSSLMISRGIPIDYGICRGIGSAGYSVTSFITGLILEHAGVFVIPLEGLVLMALQEWFVFLMLLSYRRAGQGIKNVIPAAEETKSGGGEISMGLFLKRHKIFLLMNVGIFFMFVHHQVLNYFVPQIIEGVGGSSSDTGLTYAILTLFEFPALFFFTSISKRFSASTLLKFSCICFVLFPAAMMAAPTVFWLDVTLVLRMTSFPLFLPAIVKFIAEIMSPGEAVRGQSLYVITITLSTVFTAAAGGVLLDAFGSQALLLFCTVTGLAGALMIIPLIDRAKAEVN